MTEAATGGLFVAATAIVIALGVPVAFALGAVALLFMVACMPHAMLLLPGQWVYNEMASTTLAALSLYILKGGLIGRSRAAEDLYRAVNAWIGRMPGGLAVAVIFACAAFAAMTGSSPATCSAIGGSAIAEMRRRGYSAGFSAGVVAAGGTLGILLPPSITMVLYAVASETSLGRLFLAGIAPGFLLVLLFSCYAVWRYRREYERAAKAPAVGPAPAILLNQRASWRERASALPRVLPFVALLVGVMGALYGGLATPGETAGLGAILALVLVALVYGVWRWRDLKPIFADSLAESASLMLLIGMSLLYSTVMSYLHLSQGLAEWIVALHLSKWPLLAAVLSLVIVLGFVLPPVPIILMLAPIILPPLRAAGFDLVWFGVVMTLVMEAGLIHPPIGLNLHVISRIADDIPPSQVLRGVMPFVGLLFVAVLLVCLEPRIAMAIPNAVMGPAS